MARLREFTENDRLVIEIVSDASSDVGAFPPLDRVVEIVVPGPMGPEGPPGPSGAGLAYATRALLVTAIAGGLVAADGTIVHAAGLAYRFVSGAVSVPNLPGLVPAGEINALHYGVAADGSNDDSAAIQAAIDALPASGGSVRLPSGTMAIASTVIVAKSNVRLVGTGGDNRHDAAPFVVNAGTRLKWTGSSGGTMLRFTSVSGAANPKMTGGGVGAVVLDGDNLAARCLELLSWNSGRFEDILLYSATAACLHINVVAELSDARDPQENVFERIWIASLTGSAHGIVLASGTPGANPSYNMFSAAVIQVNDGDGVALFDCDNNWFDHFRIFVTGAGHAVVFNGSDTSATDVSRDNVFNHLTTAAQVLAKGTTSFANAAGRNACFNMDQTNATVEPTVETGARLSYSYLDGAQHLMSMIKATFANNEAAANAGYERYRGGNAASAIFINDSNGHILLGNSSGTVAWVLRHDHFGVASMDLAAGGPSAAFQVGTPGRFGSYTLTQLASLAVADGNMAFVTDGRKPGEADGAGTGAYMYFADGAWRYLQEPDISSFPGFAEAVEDRVAAILREGGGITIEHDDPADTITLTGTSGGGGGTEYSYGAILALVEDF
jgi:hypothetical protein